MYESRAAKQTKDARNVKECILLVIAGNMGTRKRMHVYFFRPKASA